MEQVDEEMLHILSMDPGAYVGFSHYTKTWYVHTVLAEKLEGGSASIQTHADTPAGAVDRAFCSLGKIDTIMKDGYTSESESVYYRWNGVCFAVVPILRTANA
jgi:hypothetical protein